MLVSIVVVPVTILVLMVLIMLMLFPRAIKGFVVTKIQESTTATVIDKAIPQTVKEKAVSMKGFVKDKIKSKLIALKKRDCNNVTKLLYFECW